MRSGFAALLVVGGCGFHPSITSGDDAAVVVDAFEIDAPLPPVTCGELTCDPHAMCSGSPAQCACATGFTGDGMTCSDIDECMTGNGGCSAACLNTSGGFLCYAPQSCADVTAKVPTFHTGVTQLFLQGMPSKQWTAYCSNNKEYITLPAGDVNNYGQYTHSSNGSDVRTKYSRIRFIPSTMKVDLSDQSFATSSGSLNHTDGTHVTSMPLGVAMDCSGNNRSTGVAHIDLTGTPFIVSDTFVLGGNHPDGTATVTQGGRVVAITGGGNCGWNMPSPSIYNPFNKPANANVLDLAFSP